MAKIIALYINELIKISKKISVYVILVLMLASMFLTGGILKYAQDKMKSETTNPNIVQITKSDTESRLSNLQTQLTETNSKIASATSTQKKQLEVDATNIGYQIDSLNTATNMNIYLYTDYYVAQAILAVASYKTEANTLQALPTSALTQAQKDNQTLLTLLIPRMEKVVANKDFNEYTAIINDKITANADMSQTDKDIQVEQNNLRLKYNVTNQDKNGILGRMEISTTPDQVISKIGSARRTLASNLDFSASQSSPVPLTNERRAQIADNITVYIKQLDTGAIETNNFSLMNNILGIGTFMIIILLLILAGGAISQELSTGSIKS
ncbi:MAG TPA: hypothetical protein VFD03_07135, partial [Clostridia bacterium]|nr:hypothetical protein [Clostridia bacterium]